MDDIRLIGLMRDVITLAHDSVDPSTQNAAFLIDDTFNVRASAINQIPIGTYHRDDMWERPNKYFFVEHAERNVIYKAAADGIKTSRLTMVCPFLACADCARAIVISGIRRVVRLKLKGNGVHPGWMKSVLIGDEIMKENGVEIIELDHNFDIQIRRNEKFITI